MPAEHFIHRRHSLRTQLLLWLVPLSIGVLAISSFASHTLALKYASDAYDTGLFDSARSLAEQVRFGADGEPILELSQAAEEIIYSDPYDQVFFRVLSPTGKLVAGRADVPAPKETLNPGDPVRFYNAVVDGAPVRVGAYTLFDGKGAAKATVLVAETVVKRKRLSRSLLLTALAALIALTLVMAVTVWFGIGRGLRPLRRLAQELSQRGWNDLSPIDDRGTPEEVRPLTRAIDDLMHRLETALTAQQRFIAGAAHQLRTPLAGLTAQTERALLAREGESIKAALVQLQQSSRRVTRLVNQLLTLARAEPGSDPAREFVSLDLAALVRRICMEWVPDALERGVDLGFEGEPGPVMIRGDEFLLSEMLDNLIDNALRYGARPNGNVTIRLASSPRIELSVEDAGPGIPRDERPRVFDRFYRVPGSPSGGSGLGLAIVREIARAHGAEVSVHSGDPDGSVFRVVFEADQQSARL
jgi:two-component system, OmpR family, sensor histidine kinase TctE